MTPTPKSASDATGRHAAQQPQGAAGPFVLNLCSSTTPMALSNPEQAELKRFSFFVSRRFEEGRERFRLHMGYFPTLAEAEEWLGAVRDIYPGAWAGEAPGKKLRERAAAAAAAQAQHAAGPPPLLNVPTVHAATSAAAAAPAEVPKNVPIAKPAATAVSKPAGQPAAAAAAAVSNSPPVAKVASVPSRLPTASPVSPAPAGSNGKPLSAVPAKAAPTAVAVSASRPNVGAQPRSGAALSVVPTAVPVAKAAGERKGAPQGVAAPMAQASQGKAGAQGSAAPVAKSASQAFAPAPVASSAARASAPAAAASPVARGPASAPAVKSAAQPSAAIAATSLSQASGSAVRSAGAPPSAHAPVARAASNGASGARSKANGKGLPNSNVREVLKALEEAPSASETTGETRLMRAPDMDSIPADSDDTGFTDTQVLKYLEGRRADGTELSGVEIESGTISLLKPDDTGTRRALKAAIADNAPVSFAVQLQWSVQPVELTKVPPLAIFSAYTLYTVEGSRDGRKWYGLRLGFFSDAISAKQVAYYVRSEFNAVAVVPVSPQERERASDIDTKSHIGAPKKGRSSPVDEFKLIDSDEAPAPISRQPPPKPVVPPRTAPAAAARRGGKASNGRVRAREHRTPQTLEETLEILGAGELEVDNGTGETLNESGVRHLRVEVQKNTPFGRLLERLSERVRKP